MKSGKVKRKKKEDNYDSDMNSSQGRKGGKGNQEERGKRIGSCLTAREKETHAINLDMMSSKKRKKEKVNQTRTHYVIPYFATAPNASSLTL